MRRHDCVLGFVMEPVLLYAAFLLCIQRGNLWIAGLMMGVTDDGISALAEAGCGTQLTSLALCSE